MYQKINKTKKIPKQATDDTVILFATDLNRSCRKCGSYYEGECLKHHLFVNQNESCIDFTTNEEYNNIIRLTKEIKEIEKILAEKRKERMSLCDHKDGIVGKYYDEDLIIECRYCGGRIK